MTVKLVHGIWQVWSITQQGQQDETFITSSIHIFNELANLHLRPATAHWCLCTYAQRTASNVADFVSVHSHYNGLGRHYSRLSSTICVGLVRPHGLPDLANVRDAGYRVIQRRGDCVC